MSKIKRDQSGVSTVVIVLSLALVIILIFIGWSIYTDHHKAKKTSSTTANTTKSIQPTKETTSPNQVAGTIIHPGTYYDSTSNNPGYVLNVKSAGGGNISGNIAFVSSNGNSTQTFTYTATAVKLPIIFSTTPAMSQAVVVEPIYTGIMLIDCQKYLKYIEAHTSCTFVPRADQ